MTGTADVDENAAVRIDRLEPSTGATLETVATFSRTTGAGDARIAVAGDRYGVRWNTAGLSLDPGSTYRIHVLVGAIELGYLDVDVVQTWAEYSSVNRDEFVPMLAGTRLDIVFRIEVGAIADCERRGADCDDGNPCTVDRCLPSVGCSHANAPDGPFAGSSTTSCGTGACTARGQTECRGGRIVDICVPGAPAADDTTCDGVDDDCNGVVDDGYVTSPAPCPTDTCMHATTGTRVCTPSGESVLCSGGTDSSPPPGVPANSASNVVLLMHFDGFDGSTTFRDDSVRGHAVQGFGRARLDVAQRRFGSGASSRFDGSISDYAVIPDSDDFAFRDHDFTIDFWIRFAAVDLHGTQALVSRWDFCSDHRSWTFDLNEGRFRLSTSSDGVHEHSFRTENFTAVPERWYHVAFGRQRLDWSIFVDGRREAFETRPNIELFAGSSPIEIGVNGDLYPFHGWLDELRVTVNQARWGGAFDVPFQAGGREILSPSAGAEPALLLHFDEPSGSAALADSSLGHHPVSASGSVHTDGSAPFGSGAAVFAGGADDVVTVTDGDDFRFGSHDFTIDLWAWFEDPLNGDQTLVARWHAQPWRSWSLDLHSGTLRCRLASDSTTTEISFPWNPEPRRWYHIAVTRSEYVFRLFVDGHERALRSFYDALSASARSDPAVDLEIGANQGSSRLNGRIDELRITKGTARWVADFSAPASPASPEPELPSPSLLVHFDGPAGSTTFVDESPEAHPILAHGNVHLQTDNVRFGPAAGSFDGDFDDLIVPDDSAFHFDAHDFTIDFWIRFAADPRFPDAAQALVSRWNTRANGLSFTFDIFSGMVRFSYSNDGIIKRRLVVPESDWNPTPLRWYHFAVVRAGSTLRLYVDGVPLAEAENHQWLFDAPADLEIGINVDIYSFFGDLDELRITRGARWSHPFFPPDHAG